MRTRASRKDRSPRHLRWRHRRLHVLLVLAGACVLALSASFPRGVACASCQMAGCPPVAAGVAAPRAVAAAGNEPAGVDIRAFGARGDGITDDAPAIRRALASADAVYVPAGTYVLRSYEVPRPQRLNADFVFDLRDGQTITAAPGAVFTMAEGAIAGSRTALGGNVFLVDGKRDVLISGLTLDLNGSGNLVPAGRTITGYGLYLYSARHVSVRDVTMRNTPGQNYIVARGGDDVQVTGSTFVNGGTSLPGNQQQADFSAMSFTASRVVVDRVVIVHDVQPFSYSGGVELHGSGESVTNSRIEDSWPAVYIGPDPASGAAVMEHTTVTGNSFTGTGRGVVFNAVGVGAIDGVDISGNVFRMAEFTAFGGEPTRAIDQDEPTGGEWDYHHVITNLTITGNLFYGDGASSDAVIRLSQVHSAEIVDNRMYQVPGSAFHLASSPWGTTNVAFECNDVGWLGATGSPALVLDFSGSSTEPPVPKFSASDVSVSRNRIVFEGVDDPNCVILADWASGAEVRGIVIQAHSNGNVGLVACGPRASQLEFR